MGKIFQYSGAAYLILIMLVRMMAMQVAVLDYALNKDFIAVNLCENRSAPQSHCEGKCYLNKQLTKSGESPESPDHKVTGKVMVVDFFEKTAETSLLFRVKKLAEILRFSIGTILKTFSSGVFHPPLALA